MAVSVIHGPGWLVRRASSFSPVTPFGTGARVLVPVGYTEYSLDLTCTYEQAQRVLEIRGYDSATSIISYLTVSGWCHLAGVRITEEEAREITDGILDPLSVILPRYVVRVLSEAELMEQEASS